MKKVLSATVVSAMVLGLAACGASGNAASTTAAAGSSAAAQAETLKGEAKGFGGTVTVTITKEGDKITSATVEGKDETPDVGGKALEELGKQIVAANGSNIDGVSGATVTSTAAKNAAAQALGEKVETEAASEAAKESTQAAAESKAPAKAETTKGADFTVKGKIQIGEALSAAHGTKCFTQTYAVVSGDKVVAAYIDEYQFMDPTAEGVNPVPNSDSDFGQGYAEGVALASKRASADYYSNMMKEKAQATERIDDNYDAIEAFAAGKTIDEIEKAAGQDNVVDSVSGATLKDTANYLKAIAEAAKNAQQNEAVDYEADAPLRLNAVIGAAHGTKCFSTAAVVTDGEKIVLSYIDEFQFFDAGTDGVTGVPNSDADFAQGYAEGKVLGSKRVNADYYSELMKEHAQATTRIDDNYNAIQTAVDSMTIADAESLAGKDNAVDSVSGATLVDTANYVQLIVDAAKA